jgi:hypothetical protein
MKKIFILLLIGVFSVPINAQQTQANLDYLNNAKKKVSTGAVLTVVGVGTMVVGGVIYAKGLGSISNSNTTNEILGNASKAYTGIAVMVVGEILLDIGLPFLIVGSIQKGRAERKLQLSMVQFKSPNNYALINGIGLKIRF